MKTKQEQIEEIEKVVGYNCNKQGIAKHCPERISNGIHSAGYRKARDVIDEFVERLEKYIESRNDLWDEDRPEFDEEFVKFGIQIVADEMRQEVK